MRAPRLSPSQARHTATHPSVRNRCSRCLRGCAAVFSFDPHAIIIPRTSNGNTYPHTVALEDRTSRLTILIDPRKKAVFERLCAEEDSTPSQVVRRLIRSYIEERLGKPWRPDDEEAAGVPPPSRRKRSSKTR